MSPYSVNVTLYNSYNVTLTLYGDIELLCYDSASATRAVFWASNSHDVCVLSSDCNGGVCNQYKVCTDYPRHRWRQLWATGCGPQLFLTVTCPQPVGKFDGRRLLGADSAEGLCQASALQSLDTNPLPKIFPFKNGIGDMVLLQYKAPPSR